MKKIDNFLILTAEEFQWKFLRRVLHAKTGILLGSSVEYFVEEDVTIGVRLVPSDLRYGDAFDAATAERRITAHLADCRANAVFSIGQDGDVGEQPADGLVDEGVVALSNTRGGVCFCTSGLRKSKNAITTQSR